jgi:uncharacterized protein YjbI with pentapeptide repeats
MHTTEAEVRELASRLARKRPWCTPEENWIDAELQLSSPIYLRWRPCFLRWIGATGKSGWDWLDFCVRLSLPLTLASAGWLFSWSAQKHEQEISETSARNQFVTQYLIEMNKILQDPTASARLNHPDTSLYKSVRSITLQAIARLEGGYHSGHFKQRNAVFGFLRDSGLPVLENANLSTLDLSGTNLNGLKLPSSDLRSVILVDAYMKGTDLEGSDLRRSDLRGAYLNQANLSNCMAQDSNLSSSPDRRVDLRKAKLVNTKLARANLSGADLSSADLRFSDLSGTSLRDANLNSADLSGANLNNADLSRTNLIGAKFKNAKWNRLTIWPPYASTLLKSANITVGSPVPGSADNR